MNRVCCLPQRQDGHVAGLVDIKEVDGKKQMDLTTARFVQCDVSEEDDGAEVATKALLDETNLRASYALSFFLHTDDAGVQTRVYDMDVKYPMSPKAKSPGSLVIWVNPWHLTVGPDAALAKAIFEFNSTPVREPPVYAGRKNETIVEPDASDIAEDEI
jgi:hypothetical protein